MIRCRFSKGYPLVVDRQASLKQVIALGNYNHVSDVIVAGNFRDIGPRLRQNVLEARLASFCRSTVGIHGIEVVLRLMRLGWTLASLRETCFFGAAYPRLGIYSPILSLGSISTNGLDEFFPMIFPDQYERGRKLSCDNFSSAMYISDTRFLVVRPRS